jgi:virginiamycin B lyase
MAAAAPAHAATKPACTAYSRRGHRRGQIVTYRRNAGRDDGYGNTLYDFYACVWPDGKPRYVGSGAIDLGGEYGANQILSDLYVDAPYAFAIEESGAADYEMCGKYDPTGKCSPPTYSMRVLDVRKARSCTSAPQPPERVFATLRQSGWSCPVKIAPQSGAAPVPAGTALAEFPVTSGAKPLDLAAAADGQLWFTDSTSGTPCAAGGLARFDPATGAFSQFGLPVRCPQQLPLTVGPDGGVWVAAGGVGLERVDPATGTAALKDVRQINGVASGPGGAVWYGIAGDTRGAIAVIVPSTHAQSHYSAGLTGQLGQILGAPKAVLYFTTTDAGHALGEITAATGKIREWPTSLLTADTAASPVGAIALGAGPTLWLTIEDGYPGIGRFDVSTGKLTDFWTGLPQNSGPAGIAVGADGNVYFTDPPEDAIGRLTPSTGDITEFEVPGSPPQAIVATPDGDIWFTTAQALGRLAPSQLP